jgi:hypothetical protein
MARAAWTIEQHEDAIGVPIILMTAWDATTRQYVQLRLRDLPLAGIVAVLAWMNARLPQ